MPGPRHFSDLAYRDAAEKHRRDAEARFQARDISYPLSLLNYAVASFYARELGDAKQAFTAAYKVDDGKIPEAAKFYQWLVVDARKVYRFTKRERELVHLYLGLIYLAEDNLPEALVEFKKLRQMDQEASQLPAVNFYMGLVYEKLGQYDDALIEYRGLVAMNGAGIDGRALVERVEALQAGQPDTSSGNRQSEIENRKSVDLIVQIDHQYASSAGRTAVYADDEPVAVLASFDPLEVRLTQAEQTRKALQKASAEVTRSGLRCCGTVLAEQVFPKRGEEVADLAADIALGQEEDSRDHRAWKYAPVGVAVGRTLVPAGTREVRLEFYGTGGELLGSCRYPLEGENRRAALAAGTRLVWAGLAPEFYNY